MKKIYTILFISFFLGGLTVFAATPPALAQETPEEIARSKYSISFPIAELGSCGSLAECRTFCEDPVNYDDCVSYAKSKGFYKEDELSERQETLLDAAESELGCNNIDSCQAVCHQEENFDKCNTFAKKYGISGGHTEDPAKQEIIQKARQTLGCDSPQSCRSFCEKEENRQKCSEFAKQTGLRGGEIRQGPGGCTSEETCRAFCSDPNNYQVCRGFSQGSGGKFVGPGGCNSEESCRAYCQQNPQECGYGTGPRPTGSYNPQEMCLKTPSCKWENNTCQCGFYGNPEEAKRKSEEYSRYCQENPEKCKPGQTGGFDSPRERQKFEEYCRQNPERCKTDFQQSCSPPPSGCSGDTTWDRGTCTCKPQCPAGTSWNGSYCMKDTSGGSSQGSSLSCSPPAAGCGANLTWDQGTCTCKPSCPSGTSWNGTSCMQDSAPYGGGSSSTSSCPPPASGCGADKTWDSGTCSCKPSCPSGTSWNGNYCMQDSSSSTSGSGSSPTSPPSQPQTNSAEQECRNRSGCRWEDNTCKCESSGSSGGGTSGSNEQMESCFKQPGCRWENNTCKCEQVQGLSTPRTLFDSLFDLFFSLFRGY